MHCFLQIVTKGKPSLEMIDQIMRPYFEMDFLDKYWDPIEEDCKDIPKEAYPAFVWDYYDVWYQNPIRDVKIGECFAMIDKQGRPHVRKHWNGEVWENLEEDFDYWVKRIKREMGPNDWLSTINYHY